MDISVHLQLIKKKFTWKKLSKTFCFLFFSCFVSKSEIRHTQSVFAFHFDSAFGTTELLHVGLVLIQSQIVQFFSPQLIPHFLVLLPFFGILFKSKIKNNFMNLYFHHDYSAFPRAPLWLHTSFDISHLIATCLPNIKSLMLISIKNSLFSCFFMNMYCHLHTSALPQSYFYSSLFSAWLKCSQLCALWFPQLIMASDPHT